MSDGDQCSALHFLPESLKVARLVPASRWIFRRLNLHANDLGSIRSTGVEADCRSKTRNPFGQK
jgi:hypothetical protein